MQPQDLCGLIIDPAHPQHYKHRHVAYSHQKIGGTFGQQGTLRMLPHLSAQGSAMNTNHQLRNELKL